MKNIFKTEDDRRIYLSTFWKYKTVDYSEFLDIVIFIV